MIKLYANRYIVEVVKKGNAEDYAFINCMIMHDINGSEEDNESWQNIADNMLRNRTNPFFFRLTRDNLKEPNEVQKVLGEKILRILNEKIIMEEL